MESHILQVKDSATSDKDEDEFSQEPRTFSPFILSSFHQNCQAQVTTYATLAREFSGAIVHVNVGIAVPGI